MKFWTWIIGLFVAFVGFGLLANRCHNEKLAEQRAECMQRGRVFVCYDDQVMINGKIGYVNSCRCEAK